VAERRQGEPLDDAARRAEGEAAAGILTAAEQRVLILAALKASPNDWVPGDHLDQLLDWGDGARVADAMLELVLAGKAGPRYNPESDEVEFVEIEIDAADLDRVRNADRNGSGS
jgi:hypothetical protein